MKKTIKYLVNLICLGFLIFVIAGSYAIIVIVPNLERLYEDIWNVAGMITIVTIVFIAIITYLNFLFERKVEKKKLSREFMFISLIHLIILILAFAYFSWDFYRDYIAHPEYF